MSILTFSKDEHVHASIMATLSDAAGEADIVWRDTPSITRMVANIAFAYRADPERTTRLLTQMAAVAEPVRQEHEAKMRSRQGRRRHTRKEKANGNTKPKAKVVSKSGVLTDSKQSG